MIRLKDVELTLYTGTVAVPILRGITANIGTGDRVSIVGPSGSGKSSLLAVLGGIERPTRGIVEVDGVDLSSIKEDALAMFRRGRIGILFQSFHLIPTMTAAENVRLPLEIAGESGLQQRALDALAEVGLAHRAHHYPGQLSGGEQQRVGIARALITNPQLLLADEPTGNLDGKTGGQIIDLIFEMQARHAITMVLVTHDRSLADACDHQFEMKDGLLEEKIQLGDVDAVEMVRA
ncbi:MAG: ABC transporter ATP-binding protein [Pseudomonadota bacterium]